MITILLLKVIAMMRVSGLRAMHFNKSCRGWTDMFLSIHTYQLSPHSSFDFLFSSDRDTKFPNNPDVCQTQISCYMFTEVPLVKHHICVIEPSRALDSNLLRSSNLCCQVGHSSFHIKFVLNTRNFRNEIPIRLPLIGGQILIERNILAYFIGWFPFFFYW